MRALCTDSNLHRKFQVAFGVSTIIGFGTMLITDTHTNQPLKMWFSDSGEHLMCISIKICILDSEHVFCKKSIIIVKKIQLWDFDLFTCFEVSGIHLCYCRGDVCMQMCMCVRMWVNTIVSKPCFRLSSNLVSIL